MTARNNYIDESLLRDWKKKISKMLEKFGFIYKPTIAILVLIFKAYTVHTDKIILALK